MLPSRGNLTTSLSDLVVLRVGLRTDQSRTYHPIRFQAARNVHASSGDLKGKFSKPTVTQSPR